MKKKNDQSTTNKVVMFLFGDLSYDNRVKKEAKSLASDGYDVSIFTIENKDEEIESLIRVIKHKPLFGKKSSSTIYLFFKWCELTIRYIYTSIKIKPQIIHCHDFAPLFAAYISKKIINTKLIYDSHELWISSYRENAKILYYFEKYFIHSADKVITTNKYRARFLKNIFKIENDKICIVDNYPSFRLSNNHYNERCESSTMNNKVILYHGVIRSGRGIETIINSIKNWSEEWSFLIIGYFQGDNTYKEKLENMINKNQVSKRIIFHPPVDSNKLTNMIKDIKLGFVYYEPKNLNNKYCSPNKIWDYVFNNKPFIGNNIPGLKLYENIFCNIFDGEYINQDVLESASKIRIDKSLLQKYMWINEEEKIKALYRKIS